MIENIDYSMVNWARAQFALTAMYHWIFVPLTLGLSWLCAFYETIYVKTGNSAWRNLTRFWMRLFAINFAIGVATGIILEFEFGTNWSNFSWMVGDIFGAPLAIEGIFAFFLEATFFAVMFFGWEKVSKRFHLFSTWMVAIGSNLSAVWILVANGWMQHPVGMAFNPDTARFEMVNFWEIVFSSAAVTKFTHATSSSFVLSSLFVISVSSWFLFKKRHLLMARRSIVVAAVFGLLGSVVTLLSGDGAAYEVASFQPMKLAAIEGLYDGEYGAGLVVYGVLNQEKQLGDEQAVFTSSLKIPGLLSLLANRKQNSFVPGIHDLVYGNEPEQIMSVAEKIEKGKIAINQLASYKAAQKKQDFISAAAHLAIFNEHQDYFGYGFLKSPEEAVPPVALSFYSFHVMVILGLVFPLVCLVYLIFAMKDTLHHQKWLLLPGTTLFFWAMIASEAGWIVAEVGRQPWAIQDMLPVSVARTNLDTATVKVTFFMFVALFTVLLLAEIKIMLKQISVGPEEN